MKTLKLLRRILLFDYKDWYHIFWLIRNLLKQLFIKMNWHETVESWYWLRIHFSYDSKRMN